MTLIGDLLCNPHDLIEKILKRLILIALWSMTKKPYVAAIGGKMHNNPLKETFT